MKRATTVVLALGALVGAGIQPAQAQVVIGGSDEPNVEVNWSVIDRLGPAPTLPGMLKADTQAGAVHSQAAPPRPHQGVQFRPYKTIKKVAADRAKTKAAPTVAKAAPAPEPAPSVSPAVADLAESAKIAAAMPNPVKAEPAAAKADPSAAPAAAKTEARPAIPPKPVMAQIPEPPKAVVAEAPAKPVAAGPQVSLPEAAKPVDAVEEPKAAPVKAEPPKMVAKVEPAPVPLAPQPPMPAAVSTPAAASAVPPAAPAAVVAMNGDTMSVLFSGENFKLPDGSHADLDKLARRLEKDDGLGLQLLAYAGGDEANASKSRRLSLSRALEVRKYLMEQGVRTTRIEVRAFGNKVESGPADRVDAVLVGR